MTLDKRAREEMLSHCGQIHDDDGVDRREFFKSGKSHSDKKCRKAARLCSQVSETLGLVLAGEFDDELIHNLQVVSVESASDGAQLLVTVRADLPENALDQEQLAQRLARVEGRLRCEIAAAITRKRVPRLVFYILGTGGPGEVRP